MGLRDYIKQISPPWLYVGVGEKLEYSWGVCADLVLEKANQAAQAWMPGRGTVTALPYIGADRRIVQGYLEPDASYAVRLSQAFDAWRYGGMARGVMGQILAYLYPAAPYVAAVSNSGAASTWYTYSAGADTSLPPAWTTSVLWDWDLHSADWWWREWILLAAGSWYVAGDVCGVGGVKCGSGAVCGSGLPSSVGQCLVSIAKTWQSGHTDTLWIVVMTAGIPTPDPAYARFGKVSSGAYVIARDTSCKYCYAGTLP